MIEEFDSIGLELRRMHPLESLRSKAEEPVINLSGVNLPYKPAYQTLLKLYESFQNTSLEHLATINRAILYTLMGDYANAEACFNQTIPSNAAQEFIADHNQKILLLLQDRPTQNLVLPEFADPRDTYYAHSAERFLHAQNSFIDALDLLDQRCYWDGNRQMLRLTYLSRFLRRPRTDILGYFSLEVFKHHWNHTEKHAPAALPKGAYLALTPLAVLPYESHGSFRLKPKKRTTLKKLLGKRPIPLLE